MSDYWIGDLVEVRPFAEREWRRAILLRHKPGTIVDGWEAQFEEPLPDERPCAWFDVSNIRPIAHPEAGCAHRGKETGQDQDGAPLGFACRDCGAPVELCDCVSEGEGQRDTECPDCLGTGWIATEAGR